jgi:iron complex outermembrane receptor protein
MYPTEGEMQRSKFLYAASGFALILAAPAAFAQTVNPLATKPANDSGRLSEIVVTARKQTERLQDVPIAITALNGAQLGQALHYRIEDLNQLVPDANIVIDNGHQTSFGIRGLGNNPGNDGLEGSAGVFVDGVYLGRPGMAATDYIDIDQIEVLRGPQGTLFGKNTTAGAVTITTKLPSSTFGGDGQVSFGNYGYQQYQATVTGPLVDGLLAGRLTAYDTQRDGDVKNITTGANTNNLDRYGVRGQLLFTPSTDFKLRLIGEYEQEAQSTGTVVTLNSLGATPASIESKLKVTGAQIAIDPNGLETAVNGPTRTGSKQAAFSAQADWKVDGFTITSITAYRNWTYESLQDIDGSSADVADSGYNVHDYQWSQELRVAPPKIGPFETVVGLYYFSQNIYSDAITEYGSEAASWLSGIPNSSLPAYAKLSPAVAALLNYNDSRWDVIATPATHSYAAFGQAIWRVLPKWNITLGYRETYETKAETVSRAEPISTLTGLPNPGLKSNTSAPLSVGINNAAPSFLVSTDYHLLPTTMVYGLISQGEKAGGLNSTLPTAGVGVSSLIVKPETATDYEVGLKGEFFDRRLSLDLAAFYTEVRDYQATYETTVNGSSVQILTNVGRVRTEGLEAESTWRPFTGMTLHAEGAYDDAYYASYTNGICPAEVTGQAYCNLTGRPVAGAPKWTAGLNGLYEHPVMDRYVAYMGGEYAFKSHYYGYLDDSKYTVAGDYSLVNLRAGIRSASGLWDLMVWGKNVFNVHYVNNYLNYGALLPGAYVPYFGNPATYGVTLRAHF